LDEEDNETACYSAPDWYPSDEEDIGTKKWCLIQGDPKEEDPILEEKWTEVTHKKINQRKTKKPLSGSRNDLEGVKTHRVTRGNTRDKRTRVHDCKRGKAMLGKPKIDYQALDSHSAAENVKFNSNQVVFDNVD